MSLHFSEKELAVSCAKGDREARRVLYLKYAASVLSLCRRYVQDEQQSMDLMHDTMITVYNKIGKFRGDRDGSLFSWISRIAINTCISYLRKTKRFSFVDMEHLGSDEPIELEYERVEAIPDKTIREFVSELPEVKKTIFNLYHIDGIPHKEIARMLGITVTASTSLLSKARHILANKIRTYLDKQNE